MWIFLQFFSEFSCRGRVSTEFGTKILFSLSRPIWVLAKNNAGMRFFRFMNFFAIFFGIFLPVSSMNGIRGLKFFFLFLGLSHPVLARNNAGSMFLIFWFFLVFFWEFSCPGRVWTEFGTKFFFYISRLITSRFG